MKGGWFKKIANASVTIHGMFYVITLLIIVLLIPATPAIAKYDQSVTFDLFRLYIYPAAVAFWWKWIR